MPPFTWALSKAKQLNSAGKKRRKASFFYFSPHTHTRKKKKLPVVYDTAYSLHINEVLRLIVCMLFTIILRSGDRYIGMTGSALPNQSLKLRAYIHIYL